MLDFAGLPSNQQLNLFRIPRHVISVIDFDENANFHFEALRVGKFMCYANYQITISMNFVFKANSHGHGRFFCGFWQDFPLFLDVIGWISYGCSKGAIIHVQRAFITIHSFASVKRRKSHLKTQHKLGNWASLGSFVDEAFVYVPKTVP